MLARFLFVGLIFVGSVCCIGCGSDGNVPVSGVVNYQGKPVAGAQVMFTPATGSASDATTDEKGRFTLQSLGEPGAVTGEHRVTITKMVPKDPNDPYSAADNHLPARYASTETSGITKTVKRSGKQDFTFDLTD